MNPERVTSLSLLDRARHHDEASWRRLVTLYGPLGGILVAAAAALTQRIPPT